MIDFSRNHFDLLGLPVRYRVDPEALDTAYRRLQAEVHPDRFAGAGDAEKRLAMQASARVNEAYRALKDPVQRAQYMLKLHGIDAVGETDTALPFDFLERQLDRREEAGEALAADDARTLSALLGDIRAEAKELEIGLAQSLDERADYAAARPRVRELTFLAKLGDDVDAMLASLE
ncbi:MAG: Fe-S protein assembly co-chaperone HscB [Burkholderiales bacterium]